MKPLRPIKKPPITKWKQVDRSEGQLSAKLVITNGTTETWHDYDTRSETIDPVVGSIRVFNSATGLYEQCDTLASAKQMMASHIARLTFIEPDRN